MEIEIRVSDPQFSKSINADGCQTLDDLKRVIANEFNLQENQINIEDFPKSGKFDSKKKSYKLEIKKNSKDIKFMLPNRSSITIDDGYKEKFNDIIEKFESKSFYCSLSCAKNNLKIIISDKEYYGKDLQKVRYPFLGVPKNSSVQIEAENVIILEFDNKKFYLSEKDNARTATDFIFTALRKSNIAYDSISIIKVQGGQKLNGKDNLILNERYRIAISINFSFYNLSSQKYDVNCQLDYSAKVSEAQMILHSKFSNENFQQERFHIMTDKFKNTHADENQALCNFMSNDGFIYYDIDGLQKTRQTEDENDDSIEYTEQITEDDSDKKKKQKTKKFRVHTTPAKEDDSSSNDEDSNKSKKKKAKEETKSRNSKVIKGKKKSDSSSSDEDSDKSKNKKTKKETKSKNSVEIEEEEEENSNNDENESASIEFVSDNKKLHNFICTVNINTTLDDLKEEVKKRWKIKEDIDIKYKLSSGRNLPITNDDELMGILDPIIDKENKRKPSNTFCISIIEDSDSDEEEVKKKSKRKSKKKSGKYKISYQSNKDDEPIDTSLSYGTNVKQFKEIIAKKYNVENLADIKIIFAGKDLLNDIVIDELNVGDTVLNVYIRSIDDIFLMTAKALRVTKDDRSEESD